MPLPTRPFPALVCLLACAFLQLTGPAAAQMPPANAGPGWPQLRSDSPALPECAHARPERPCVMAPMRLDRAPAGAQKLEAQFRRAAGEPDWPAVPEALGVALSGGGSKAAAFAMGVLAALDDMGLLLHAPEPEPAPEPKRRVKAISSVSGGGYAAYFLYSHLLANDANLRRPGALFDDCISLRVGEAEGPVPLFAPALAAKLQPRRCAQASSFAMVARRGGQELVAPRNPTQGLLRCGQDVLQPGECEHLTQGEDANIKSQLVGQAVLTLLAAGPNFLANTLFDSGLNLSPSRAQYRLGIHTAYGSVAGPGFRVPARSGEGLADVLAEGWRMRLNCPEAREPGTDALLPHQIERCDSSQATVTPPEPGFEALRQAWLDGGASAGVKNVPYWIIQASAPQQRSLAGWLARAKKEHEPALDAFEFTPLLLGSRRYGWVRAHPAHMTLVDAVASSAAFLDANQQIVDGPVGRLGVAAGLHLFALSWGIDLPNYNVSALRRSVHRVLPVPFFWLDSLLVNAGVNDTDSPGLADLQRSAFIRLQDGGNTDNTGAYALLRRHLPWVVISDGGQDRNDIFDDLCHLRRSVAQEGDEHELILPGLENFDDHCSRYMKDGNDGVKGYALDQRWPHSLPVLLGCVRRIGTTDGCRQARTRLVVVKPFVDPGHGQPDAGATAAAPSSAPAPAPQVIAQCLMSEFPDETGLRLAKLWRDDGTGKVEQLSCRGHEAQCARALPCEAARHWRVDGRDANFPRGSTVLITLNSSSTIFAAYRELARLALLQAQEVLRGDDKVFDAAVEHQSKSTVKHKVKLKG